MGRLIIVANRLPYYLDYAQTPPQLKPCIGGLATGLKPLLLEEDTLWIGSLGVDQRYQTRELEVDLKRLKCVPFWLKKEAMDGFYTQICNDQLWPLFHQMPHKMVAYPAAAWQKYKEVNQEVADLVAAQVQPGDTVFVQDYHFMLLPRLLRNRFPQVSISWFLHIPFPEWDAVRNYPQAAELIDGIRHADRIGCQTPRDCHHLREALKQVRNDGEGRGPKILIAPLPVTQVEPIILTQPPGEPEVMPFTLPSPASLSQLQTGQKILLTVDRVDFTKGMAERLQAFHHFLTRYPEFKTRLTYCMIGIPTRTAGRFYREMGEEVGAWVEKINRAHGTPGHMPIRWIQTPIPNEELLAYYQKADVVWINSLKDGLNLVAKEFVRYGNPKGRLILSKEAGAAVELTDAILVNPRDEEELVNALYQALSLSEEEAAGRMNKLRERVSQTTLRTWLNQMISPQEADWAAFPPVSPGARLALDYDGTLVPFHSHPHLAVPDPELYDSLNQLTQKFEVAIVSSRDKPFLDTHFSGLPIDLIAENGAFLKRKGNPNWEKMYQGDGKWKPEIQRIVHEKTSHITGTWIEEKETAITLHYRLADDTQIQALLPELRRQIDRYNTASSKTTPLEWVDGDKVIEIKPAGFSKGSTLLKLITPGQQLLAMGDSDSDESMFEAMPESVTIKITPDPKAHTSARYRLPSIQSARAFLKSIAP